MHPKRINYRYRRKEIKKLTFSFFVRRRESAPHARTVSSGTDDLVDVRLSIRSSSNDSRAALTTRVECLLVLRDQQQLKSIAKFFCLLFEQLKDNLPSITRPGPSPNCTRIIIILVFSSNGIPRGQSWYPSDGYRHLGLAVPRTFTTHKTHSVVAIFEPHQWWYCIWYSIVRQLSLHKLREAIAMVASQPQQQQRIRISISLIYEFDVSAFPSPNPKPMISLFWYSHKWKSVCVWMHAFIECSSHARTVIIGNIQKAKK